MKIVLLCVLLALSCAVRLNSKQGGNGNGFQQSAQEAAAGVQELGQVNQDILNAGNQAINAVTQNIQQFMQQATQAMGGNNAGSRLQQNGQVSNEQIQEAIRDLMNGNTQALTNLVNTVMNSCKFLVPTTFLTQFFLL
jgi:predicted PurR-regulated permease PerM